MLETITECPEDEHTQNQPNLKWSTQYTGVFSNKSCPFYLLTPSGLIREFIFAGSLFTGSKVQQMTISQPNRLKVVQPDIPDQGYWQDGNMNSFIVFYFRTLYTI
ncbi:hypothetical protein LMH87_005006 [Akanthomyces muscarius]|uniref:Uncharacterized protein n=1 Tax=Akanthomyces muscarius TaxID=2231603 RepID=A0A9W8QLM9_AKAMU|nr:hypothetical protein LMH87_005006 [Akanthomyces muscarius]KAJ4163265.1 hypothetical protein LMH87_005006 [Akanthomyces muscarius]